MPVKHKRPPLSEEERAERRRGDREYARAAVERLRSSEGWQQWLASRRHFHTYSLVISRWVSPTAHSGAVTVDDMSSAPIRRGRQGPGPGNLTQPWYPRNARPPGSSSRCLAARQIGFTTPVERRGSGESSFGTVCVSGDGGWARWSVDAFDDAEVALDGVGEGHQRLLVCLALVCRDGLFKTVELDQNDA